MRREKVIGNRGSSGCRVAVNGDDDSYEKWNYQTYHYERVTGIAVRGDCNATNPKKNLYMVTSRGGSAWVQRLIQMFLTKNPSQKSSYVLAALLNTLLRHASANYNGVLKIANQSQK